MSKFNKFYSEKQSLSARLHSNSKVAAQQDILLHFTQTQEVLNKNVQRNHCFSLNSPSPAKNKGQTPRLFSNYHCIAKKQKIVMAKQKKACDNCTKLLARGFSTIECPYHHSK